MDVDWGTGELGMAFGMQLPPGHRNSIHNGNFREIGVGVVLGTNTGISHVTQIETTVGPLILTQDFGPQSGATPFITGVVYYDLNGNNFYDLDEGMGGFRVDVVGSSFFAVTAQSGGYSVPVLSDGNYETTFSAPCLEDFIVNVLVSNNENEKQDYILQYTPPSITPPAQIFAGSNNTFTFTMVGGATSYIARDIEVDTSPWTEGGEDGSSNVTITSSEGYDVIQSASVSSGSFRFRLHHVFPVVEAQYMVIDRRIRPSSQSELQFQSRLFDVTDAQVALVQVSTDGGVTWLDIFSQEGTLDPALREPNFSLKTSDLSNFADEEITIRFCYDFTGGQLFGGDDVGWFFDDITVTNAVQIQNESETDIGDVSSFFFNPPSPGDYLLQVVPRNLERRLPSGPGIIVEAVEGNGGFVDPFSGQDPDLGGGFYFSDWYGIYNPLFYPWVFHIEHGWQYIFDTGTSGEVYIYDLECDDFWWSNSTLLAGTFYSFNRTAFIFYFAGSTNPRNFVNLETEEFFSKPAP